MAALMAPLAGRLTDRYGPRVAAVPGTLLFSTGPLPLALTATAQPHHWPVSLPSATITGVGAGLCLTALGGAAVLELPPPSLGTGIGMTSALRQLGAVVGVAALVALPRPARTPGPRRLLPRLARDHRRRPARRRRLARPGPRPGIAAGDRQGRGTAAHATQRSTMTSLKERP